MSKAAGERSFTPLAVANRSGNHTTRVCQATLTSGSELARPRRADEGTIPNSPLPIASEELREREHRATTDAATPFIPRVRPRGEFAALPGQIKI